MSKVLEVVVLDNAGPILNLTYEGIRKMLSKIKIIGGFEDYKLSLSCATNESIQELTDILSSKKDRKNRLSQYLNDKNYIRRKINRIYVFQADDAHTHRV